MMKPLIVLSFQYNNIKCGSSNKTIVNVFCKIKAYSRTFSTFNFGFDVPRQLDEFNVTFRTFILFMIAKN